MDYTYFTIEDFVADDYFRQWVKHPDKTSSLFWQTYLAKYPEQAETIRLAAETVNNLSDATAALSTPATAHEKAAIWTSIKTHVLTANDQQASPFLTRQLTTNWRWLAVAASVVIVLGLGWWAQRTYPTANPVTPGQVEVIQPLSAYVEQHNSTDTPQVVTLSDGTSIILRKGSQIRYPQQFTGGKRVVYLAGEAFFEVAKDAKRPFFVYTNKLVTKVLGTSFTIKAYGSDKDVTVTVRTGRVAVFTQSDEEKVQKINSPTLDGVVLTKNQQLVFSKEQMRMTTPKELPAAVAQRLFTIAPASFQFDARPVSEVFSLLERVYGINVIYDKATLGTCRLTADLTDEPLADKLLIICKSIEATYTITDRQVTISGAGCGS
ncbi:FecR domain-containing protein [Fibrella sp. USSR17]